ncbi:IDEAL domain-containing protein [Clostridium tyrobutyricum]|uniref:IDEAL domain-containing protein n=1 Tax=Clostridium tyrobutyricum DIVETGP TaxID=1408889 RepID=W6NHD4_CLOTY|nr:IDEAL domain-containing protein [Clostridium tyrobutyricum]AND84243.1 hypothetical protein CTK_C09820 [Clostridium tyrobutyricum]AND84327.1 hypothetical protein CTK_C10660 [Clostridium tyrobutyricum]ANP68962.1 hypothetical protein BA182_04525 [Clostridium tyrobutyricum]MBV4435479.1 IDEAL domain-containing protein [Clostridium tyrobutyricum]QNB66690.1 IDEAL domain-containing protein [Clostridium tyrobutyricum]
MGKGLTNKEKCFVYFSENDDKDRDELIADAAREFKITKMSVKTYYYAWKKEYMDGDIKIINHNPESGRKVKSKKPLTDEMIIDELTEHGFSYLSETPEMIKCIADKFRLEEHTAKFRIDELLKNIDKSLENREHVEVKPKEETKVSEVKKDERLTEEEIDQLCENTEYEKPKPKKLLKIALLQGKVMNYEIQDEGFLLRQGSSSNTIPIGKKDIDDFIEELKELKEVIV